MSDASLPEGAIIITGAAGGMGRPAAIRFARRGQPLILCDVSAERLDALAEELRAGGAQVSTLAGDVAAPDFPAQVLELLGDQDIAAMIHTAGLSPTMADGERVFEVNYFATVRLVDAVAPRMASGGCAVLISSVSAYMIPQPEFAAAANAVVQGDRDAVAPFLQSPQSAYPLSKLAIIRLVAHEAKRFGTRGARIVSIAPGYMDTGMGRQEADANAQMRGLIERVPLGRMGQGDEIAAMAEFLCTPGASYVSGCDIRVDGGAVGELGL